MHGDQTQYYVENILHHEYGLTALIAPGQLEWERRRPVEEIAVCFLWKVGQCRLRRRP